jgi:hypothetical protein
MRSPAQNRSMRSDLTVFDVVNPGEMNSNTRDVSFLRRLQDRDLIRRRFDEPISRFTGRIFGALATSSDGDRFATQVDVGGDGTYFGFYAMLHGRMTLSQHGCETICAGSDGLVFRFTHGTRLLTSDLSARRILYIETSGACAGRLARQPVT